MGRLQRTNSQGGGCLPCRGGLAAAARGTSLHGAPFRAAHTSPEPVPRGPASRRRSPGRSSRSPEKAHRHSHGGRVAPSAGLALAPGACAASWTVSYTHLTLPTIYYV